MGVSVACWEYKQHERCAQPQCICPCHPMLLAHCRRGAHDACGGEHWNAIVHDVLPCDCPCHRDKAKRGLLELRRRIG